MRGFGKHWQQSTINYSINAEAPVSVVPIRDETNLHNVSRHIDAPEIGTMCAFCELLVKLALTIEDFQGIPNLELTAESQTFEVYFARHGSDVWVGNHERLVHRILIRMRGFSEHLAHSCP